MRITLHVLTELACENYKAGRDNNQGQGFWSAARIGALKKGRAETVQARKRESGGRDSTSAANRLPGILSAFVDSFAVPSLARQGQEKLHQESLPGPLFAGPP